jgi:transcriptional regulator of acetoin/glycerol metabolism
MYENAIFSLSGSVESKKEDLSKLQEILKGTGINAKIREDGEHSYLIFNYDTDRVKQIRTRGAGRKEVYSPIPVTCAEVAEMRKTMNEAEILEQLGMSRSTYYRRLKRLDGHFSDDQYL